MKNTKLISKTDIIIVISVAVVAFSAFLLKNIFTSGEYRIAVIEVDGSEVLRIDLDEVKKDYVTEITGKLKVEISVSKNGICFVSSECSGKICVSFGVLTKSGDFAVCVPARVAIYIDGEKEFDGIAG